MQRPVPQIRKFDDRDPARHTLYPMPLPHGPRVVAITDGLATNVLLTNGSHTTTSLNGFAPRIEQAITDLYHAMLAEPQPGITVNGQLKYRPGIVFDMILHDRRNGGAADITEKALADFLFDESLVADDDALCALVLATVPLEAFKRGRDTVDLWCRRSHVKRGCRRLGSENVHANPHPLIRTVTLAPGDWSAPEMGCAGEKGGRFWLQVSNCFMNNYAGCLIMDVMQPWNVAGDHYQLIAEQDAI